MSGETFAFTLTFPLRIDYFHQRIFFDTPFSSIFGMYFQKRLR